MRSRSILIISLVVLAGWFLIVMYVSGDAIEAMSALGGTVEPEGYLPLVYKQPTPTPTPTATPTPTPLPITVNNNHSSFAHSDGGYSVVGEITNNTGSYAWNIQVGAKFYKYGQSEPVATISQPVHFIFRLKPGRKTCFALDTWSGSINDWDYYVFDEVTAFFDSTSPPSINIVGGVTALIKPGEYELSGLVQNDYSGTVYNARVQGTLYDKNGTVLDCRWAYALPPTLAAGQMAGFVVDFSSRWDGYNAVRSYRVERQGEYGP